MKFSPIQTAVILSVTGSVAFGVLVTLAVVFQTPSPKQPADSAEHEHSVSTTAVRTSVMYVEPSNYDAKVLDEYVDRECPASDASCLTKVLLAITERNGPRASLTLLHRLQEQNRTSSAADDQHPAHEIGRKTAQRFGINGRAFMLCPTSFDYGCQNGFFQYALGQAHTADNAARLICGSLDESYSATVVFQCYLGVGHGVFTATNYDLTTALGACDTLETHTGQDGCWQGVFMENGNRSREDFSQTDPLAPCNIVPDKYRRECFINHAGVLMKFFSNQIKPAADACLKAPDAYVSSCLQSIGLMVSHPSWQPLLSTNTGMKTAEAIAWDLCLKFPRGHREPCVMGAVDNILNSDELEVARAKIFCHTVDAAYRMGCYHRIGVALRTHAIDPKIVLGKCTTLDGAAVRPCLRGAGEETPAHPALAPKASVRRPFRQIAQGASEGIFKNDAALYSYVKQFGLAQTITSLHALVPRYGSCHTPAHKAGRFAYSIFSMEAFRSVAGECHAGGFHGAVEAYFKERGAAHLADDVKLICRSELNRFNSHQCRHGIGHGLMAAADYELPQALERCDSLKEIQESCWSGAFMENIVGGLGGHEGHVGHTTKYLNDDPHYPCTVVAERYKGTCYHFQPARMMQLFEGDFRRVAASCATVPGRYQGMCFESMGREAGGASEGKPHIAIQACRHASDGKPQVQCLVGAVQDTFWDPAGQDPALKFCALLNRRTEKDACYEMIFSRAPQILLSQREMQSFCKKVEAVYRSSCLKKRTV